jgi:geranylgeranyl diphosphate synthase type II
MRLALRVGAILAGANHQQLTRLSRFAGLLGDAYQLSDDLLDLEEDGEIFSVNKTFAANRGIDAARLKLQTIVEEAKQVLIENYLPSDARDCLIQLTDYLAERKN